MINLTIEGTVVREPRVRDTKAGKVTVMTVVHNERRKDTDGKWVNKGRGLFVEIACWRKLGEHVADLKKGTLVTVETDNLELFYMEGMTTLKANARNVSVSLRFDGATSHRIPREHELGDSVITPEGDEFTGEEYAEYTAERQLASA